MLKGGGANGHNGTQGGVNRWFKFDHKIFEQPLRKMEQKIPLKEHRSDNILCVHNSTYVKIILVLYY